ncbi:MAG: hypothetical protein M1825_004595 [Sarcosagium campestre]|nr:MAG: hypothetical protein M1825_004595 [Sarcosagium campestre]
MGARAKFFERLNSISKDTHQLFPSVYVPPRPDLKLTVGNSDLKFKDNAQDSLLLQLDDGYPGTNNGAIRNNGLDVPCTPAQVPQSPSCMVAPLFQKRSSNSSESETHLTRINRDSKSTLNPGDEVGRTDMPEILPAKAYDPHCRQGVTQKGAQAGIKSSRYNQVENSSREKQTATLQSEKQIAQPSKPDKDGTNDAWNPGTIPIYLVEDSPGSPNKVEMVFMVLDESEKKRLELCPWEKFSPHTMGEGESWKSLTAGKSLTPVEQPLEALVDDLQAFSTFIRNKRREDTATFGLRGNPHHFKMYIQKLQEVSAHNISVQANQSSADSAPTSASMAPEAVKARMQTEWNKKYSNGVLKLTQQKQQTSSSSSSPPLPTDNADAPPTPLSSQEKYLLAEQTLAECARDEVRSVEQLNAASLAFPLSKLEELYVVFKSQMLLLHEDEATLKALIVIASDQRERLANTSGPSLDALADQLDALVDLHKFGNHAVRALQTRLNRLAAKDVRDRIERARVREDRLARPEALLYLWKAWGNIEFIRDWAGTVRRGVESAARELEGLARGVETALEMSKEAAVVLETQNGNHG